LNQCSLSLDRQTWKRILDLGDRLASAQSIVEQHELITATIAQELGAETELWLVSDLWQMASAREHALFSEIPPTETMRRAARERQTVLVRDGDPRGSQVIALPLQVHDSLLGVLELTRQDTQISDGSEIELLECIGQQIAVILQTKSQLALGHWQEEQLALVREVSAQVANVVDLDQLARRTTKLVLQTFQYYYVALYVIDPKHKVLRLQACAGPMDDDGGEVDPLLQTIRLGDGIVGQVGQTGTEIVANDVRDEPRYRSVEALPDTQSEVALPLKVSSRVLGVLDIQSDRRQDLHEFDLLTLHALAESIAVAVEHAQIYQSLERRAEQFSVLAEVNRVIASALEEDELLSQLAQLIHRQLGYPFVHLFTIDPVHRQVVYRVGQIPDDVKFPESLPPLELDDENEIISWVANRGETGLENDIQPDPRFPISPLRAPEVRSELTVPLIFRGQVLGVLDIQSDQTDAFDMDTYFMFRTLADTVAVALRNISLYQTERWRSQVADSMREAAGLLSSDMVLEEVLNAILGELERTLPCDVAAICMVEDQDLTLAAVRHTGLDLDLAGFSIDANPWIEQALTADEPLVRPATAPLDPIAQDLQFPEHYSAIAAPLQTAGQLPGLLYMAHRTPARYGGEAQTILSAFASYAAVAIENARVYQASQEQALISAVMLQVAEATQSLSTLDEVLKAVVRLVPLLVGVNRCAILLWDHTDDTFYPAASYGLGAEQTISFDTWLIDTEQPQILEELVLTKSPLVIHDIWTDTRAEGTGLADLGFESILALPLLARGEVLGAMLVDYRGDLFAYDTVETIRDEQLTIIQGIAHQAATAIENAQLRENQQQDAYVSAALLQVAQTVTSMNDLDDILGAIVRITPILVGVERCILFCRDAANQKYYATHTYGLPSEAEAGIVAQRFAPGDFGLLDAITRENRLVICNRGDPDGAMIPRQFADYMDYLLETGHSLLGFPLSVKGDVLGALVLEEPTALHGIQERRIEIITGIAQQAALALQNDQLQQARLGQERLERELQLARGIQQAFIPDQQPQMEGWQLSALWKAARQVAGDFYDLLELPEGKLGLLIADVADKGMPAALFMMLTRTLVRAAVRNALSPAQVLTSVNDLLVPDAKQGMFVTAFYAVLSPDDGQFVYANAGHNPPLLCRAGEGTAELLEKGGIALGVIGGDHFQDRSITLRPGDTVVFYTDGITEAMSPDGELFGEQRLLETVRSQGICTADKTLTAIEESVVAHRSTAPTSDDITLLVLQRLP